MITVKAPGKLYIAGEYAVLENNCPAVLVAVNEFVTVSIAPSKTNRGLIHSKQYASSSIHWVHRGNRMVIDRRDAPFEYILSAIRFTEAYCLEKHVPLTLYDLDVNSELDSADGKKYGLGSSAAVTVATVKAILAYYHMPATNDLIFKLAAIAHYTVQGNGSAGDIAASVYGGWLAYQTFNKAWLEQAMNHLSLSEVVSQAWPGLKVQLLTPPKGMQLLIGWSQQPASTSQLVDKTNAKKHSIQNAYNEFLNNSRECVLKMISGFSTGDIALIQRQIRRNRTLLQEFANLNHIAIEIPRLSNLIAIAEKFGGAAKTSGAGNGDCGIVIADSHTQIEQMKALWLENGILPLNFRVHSITKQFS